jgi:hypothetical protein
MASPNFVRTALVLRGGQPSSRPGHRNKVAFFDDLHASPDDLRLAIGANVEVGHALNPQSGGSRINKLQTAMNWYKQDIRWEGLTTTCG